MTLTDGTALPGRHDGMGAFHGPRHSVILVRNHEVNNPGPAFGPGDAVRPDGAGRHDDRAGDATGRVMGSFTSLNGTMMNCSGGQMPWGSWVTCEETVNGPDVGPDFTGDPNIPLTKPHGYVFEVPVSHIPGHGQSKRKPISTPAGSPTRRSRSTRRAAISTSPRTTSASRPASTATGPGAPEARRQAARRRHAADAEGQGRRQGPPGGAADAGATYDVEWVDIPEPDVEFPYTPGQPAPTPNDTALVFVGDQGRAQGAAGFSRLEGQAYDAGVVYFTSTQGGGAAETGPDTVAATATGRARCGPTTSSGAG